MIKKCYVLDGKIINIGEWDYQEVINEQGEEVVNNPLPEGTVEEELDFEYDEDRGWFEVGTILKLTEVEILKLKLLEQEKTMEELMFNVIPDIIGGGM